MFLGTVIHFLSSHPVWCVLCCLPVSLFASLEYLRDTPISFFHELAIIQATRMVFSYILYVSILYEHIMISFDNASLRHHLFHHNELLQNRNTNKR